MKPYEKKFKEEAVKLSDEIGVKKTSQQLGVPYYTLSGWRSDRKAYGDRMSVGSGQNRKKQDLSREDELNKENAELRRSNEILKEALCFFVKYRKK